MTKARLHAVALIAPKSWILKFETKKDAEISPRSSVPRLENFQSKTQTRNKEINEAFSSRDSCSIALLDQYFNHSHKLVTVDLLGRHYVAITQQEKSSIQDSIGPPSKRMAHVLWSTLRDICQVKEKLRKRDEMPPKIHTKLAEIFELGALILWGRFRLQEETSTYSWLLTICQNGSKQKRSPPMMPELYSRIVKALDSVIFNSSFTSSASFWEFTLREDSAILSMGDLERITRKDEKKYKPKQTKPDSEWKAVKDKAQAKAKDQEKSKSKSNQQINSQNGADKPVDPEVRGKARHSVSSTSTHHNLRSSSHQGDNDEDDGASRASTPSPTTYLNTLNPLDYQAYHMPSPSEQTDKTLFASQTTLLN
ncbi:hypothetical protein Tco_1228818 [Tanacetum coccineum]